MCRLAKTLLLIASLAAVAVLAAFSAHGGPTEESVKTCRDALVEQSNRQWDARSFQFDSIRGGALKKLTFRLSTEAGVEKIRCHVRRGVVQTVTWPEGLEPAKR